MTMIVAFTGRKGSGKDTAAQVLLMSGQWGQINFADKLKEVCNIAYGLTFDQMNSPSLKQVELEDWPFRTPREHMQEVAEMWRSKYPDIWVIAWNRAVADLNPNRIVVTDLRYPNEVSVLRAMQAIIIKIERPNLKDDEFSNHASESHYDAIDADITITNDGDIHTLHNKVTASLLGKVPSDAPSSSSSVHVSRDPG